MKSVLYVGMDVDKEKIALAVLRGAETEVAEDNAKNRRKVSVGQAVQAMIVDALGFSGRALYLNTRFYESRPVEVPIGEGRSARDLQDSSLGTAFDAIYEYLITELFFLWPRRSSPSEGSRHVFPILIQRPSAYTDSTTRKPQISPKG